MEENRQNEPANIRIANCNVFTAFGSFELELRIEQSEISVVVNVLIEPIRSIVIVFVRVRDHEVLFIRKQCGQVKITLFDC